MAPVYARCFTKMHELLHGREKVRQEQGQRQEGKEQKQEQVRSSSSECSQSKLVAELVGSIPGYRMLRIFAGVLLAVMIMVGGCFSFSCALSDHARLNEEVAVKTIDNGHVGAEDLQQRLEQETQEIHDSYRAMSDSLHQVFNTVTVTRTDMSSSEVAPEYAQRETPELKLVTVENTTQGVFSNRTSAMNYDIVTRRLQSVWNHNFRITNLLRRKAFRVVFVAVALLGMLSVFGCMNPGMPYRNSHGQPRNHAHVGDAGPPFVGTATLKVPPAWSAERAHWYSLRSWVSDLVLWSASTDIDVQRQGPIAALQVTGAAKELIREIAPAVLQHGRIDPQTGAQVSGLMVLAETLVARYAPLDAEVATRAVSELIHFKRLPGESTDAFLVRFDVVKNRAANRGAMAMSYEGIGWLLLQGLGCNAEQWDRLLFHNEGRLPQNEQELGLLVDRIRRTGHLYEGGHRHMQQGGTGDPGQFFQQQVGPHPMSFFPTFEGQQFTAGWPADGSYLGGNAFFGNMSKPPMPASAAQMPHEYHSEFNPWQDEQAACTQCGQFFEDEDISSATDSNDDMLEVEAYTAYQHIKDETMLGNELYLDYLAARSRWRRFSGKPPRRYRRYNNRPDRQYRQKSKLSRGPFAGTYASFLPQNSFAGGKGKGGKGKSKQGRKNPRGKDGKTLLCATCGSDSHLWRNCPQNAGKQQASGNSPPTLAMLSNVVDQPVNSLPGVTFNYMMSSGKSSPPDAMSVASQSLSGYEAELASLRSVTSQKARRRPHETNAEEQSSKSSRVRDPEQHSPTAAVQSHSSASSSGAVTSSSLVNAFLGGHSSSLRQGALVSTSSDKFPQSYRQGSSVLQVPNSWSVPLSQATKSEKYDDSSAACPGRNVFDEEDEQPRSSAETMPRGQTNDQTLTTPEGQTPGAFETPNSSTENSFCTPEQRASSRTVLTLHDLLHYRDQPGQRYSWWESGHAGQSTAERHSYHVRTRIDGQVGLLVDPGAHDNLIGSETCQLMQEQLSAIPTAKRLDRPLVVSGVGKSSQEATSSVTIPCSYKTTEGDVVEGTYSAPVVPSSSLPPLLGLKSLRTMKAVVDTATPALIIPGPGGLEFKLSPGTYVHELKMSDSGHLILPVGTSQPGSSNDNPKVGRLDFTMQCRKTRSRTPERDPNHS